MGHELLLLVVCLIILGFVVRDGFMVTVIVVGTVVLLLAKEAFAFYWKHPFWVVGAGIVLFIIYCKLNPNE